MCTICKVTSLGYCKFLYCKPDDGPEGMKHVAFIQNKSVLDDNFNDLYSK
jgi:hypothetical protein